MGLEYCHPCQIMLVTLRQHCCNIVHFYWKSHLSHVMRKPVYFMCEQQGTDQPAHPRSLISIFIVRCLHSIIPLVSISEISSLYLAPGAEQVGNTKDRFSCDEAHLSQLMRLWYLSLRRTGKARARLHIHAIWPEPSLYAHIKYGRKWRVWPKIRRVAPVDCCACMFEDWVYGGR